MTRAIIALPNRDFDVTEVATPWHRLREAGVEVAFASEDGAVAMADPLLISGVLFGQLGAKQPALERYYGMIQSPEFQHPLTYAAIDPDRFDALVLPGGHAAGMRPYLESRLLQEQAARFLQSGKPVGAICHGLLVLARATNPVTGRSPLYERRTTGLLKLLERTGYYLTFWKLGRYYRTYPAYVEDEIKAQLRAPEQFERGKAPWVPFAMRDGNLITARWPKDAEVFSSALLEALRMTPSLR